MSESVSLSPELLFIRDASSLNASAGNEVPPDGAEWADEASTAVHDVMGRDHS